MIYLEIKKKQLLYNKNSNFYHILMGRRFFFFGCFFKFCLLYLGGRGMVKINNQHMAYIEHGPDN